MRCLLRLGLVWAAIWLAGPAGAAHGYSQWGTFKYGPGFAHFEWVAPQAPKGGDMVLVSHFRVSNFDKFNPFTLKGTFPPYLDVLAFDTLLASSSDEQGTAYGLLAEDVVVAPDGRSATFRLNRLARFRNGDPVLAADVKHSFDALVSPLALPGWKALFEDVRGATVVDERTVRFDFKRLNRELPLTVGSLPVFSRKWGGGKPFDQIIMEEPISSGPYRIGSAQNGKDLVFLRNADYWARDLNVRKGMYNFDRITVKIYKDNTARLEGFKAGEFDFLQEFVSRDWVRAYKGRKFESGELVQRRFEHKLPHGIYSQVFNLRRPKFQDIRVRKALNYAFDYEWMNRQLFYGSYVRLQSYISGTEYAASGVPGPQESALLEPFRGQLPAEVFGPLVTPPRTDPPANLRDNLRQARDLLAEAGWKLAADGRLRNAAGEPFVIEYVDSQEGSLRTLEPWVRALRKLGIGFDYRQFDYSVYQERLQKFQFDVVGVQTTPELNPGNSLLAMFGSDSAAREGSNNLWGIRNLVVDHLLGRLQGASTHAEAMASGRALDRVLMALWISVPQWTNNNYRIAYNQIRFHLPPVVPAYYQAEEWAMATWWARR
jgi:microcin C transport system substrate-binding protein